MSQWVGNFGPRFGIKYRRALFVFFSQFLFFYSVTSLQSPIHRHPTSQSPTAVIPGSSISLPHSLILLDENWTHAQAVAKERNRRRLSEERRADMVAENATPLSTPIRQNHFVGHVSIGTPPQSLYLIFDTGSTNIQIVSKQCPDVSCFKVTQFDPDSSSTFAPFRSLGLHIAFGTGAIHALLGQDTVTVGPFTVHNQTIGVIDREWGNLKNGSGRNVFDEMHFEGIVGFGFPSLATPGTVPFFDNLMKSTGGNVRQFAIYTGPPELGQDPVLGKRKSAFLIGGVDKRLFHGQIKMVPVIREHYWQLGLDSFWVGDVKFCCDQTGQPLRGLPLSAPELSSVIIDTGTTFNTIPSDEFERFMSLVPERPCDINDKTSLSSFPVMTYKLSGGVEITVTPEMYVIPSPKTGLCKPSYMSLDIPKKFGLGYVLGSIPFIRHHFTVFQRGRNGEASMVGIAKANHSPEALSFLETIS